MGFKDPTYVVFDGDNDKWAYAYMKGWKANDRIDFDFRDAHELDSMTGNAQNEEYVKSNLRKRMFAASAVVVLIGEKTRWLYKYVRWELELALELGLPIVAVSLNNDRVINNDLCPPILRNECIVNVPFQMKAIKYALDNWGAELKSLSLVDRKGGPRYYTESTYKSMGL